MAQRYNFNTGLLTQAYRSDGVGEMARLAEGRKDLPQSFRIRTWREYCEARAPFRENWLEVVCEALDDFIAGGGEATATNVSNSLQRKREAA